MSGGGPDGASYHSNPWWRVAIGGGAGMLIGMGLGRFSYTTMVPALVLAEELTALEAGRVGTVNIVSFALGALLSVPLRARIDERRLLALAAVISLVALAASAAALGFWWLAFWRGLLGVTAGIIMVLSAALVTSSAPQARRPLAAGMMFAGVGIGVLLAGVLVPMLLAHGLAAAWLGLAAVGGVAAVIAVWGWSGASAAGRATPAVVAADRGLSAWPWQLKALLVSHTLFSVAIVPHSLYWVDYIARGLGLGMATGGFHWSLVGIASILGPALGVLLAFLLGTAWALPLSFLVLGLGIGLPLASAGTAALVASSLLFGAQPGLSALMAARARDLSAGADMAHVMRAMILASSVGGVTGGLVIPEVLAASGQHAVVFAIGGVVMVMAGLLTLPYRRAG